MGVIYKLVMKISILFELFFFYSHRLQTNSLYPLIQLQIVIGLEAIDYDNCIKHCLWCVRYTKNTVKEPKFRKNLLLANLQNFESLSSYGLGSEMLIFPQMAAPWT